MVPVCLIQKVFCVSKPQIDRYLILCGSSSTLDIRNKLVQILSSLEAFISVNLSLYLMEWSIPNNRSLMFFCLYR